MDNACGIKCAYVIVLPNGSQREYHAKRLRELISFFF